MQKREVVSYRNSTSNHNEDLKAALPGFVVSYRNSTSNHNYPSHAFFVVSVVSYRNSTSNHNQRMTRTTDLCVVSYRNSTSNHNLVGSVRIFVVLYLIEILHQTTTTCTQSEESGSCILSKFYIKPQQSSDCLICFEVVSYRNSTSNHNDVRERASARQLYLIEILHQTTTAFCAKVSIRELYLIEILHQTTTEEPTFKHRVTLYLIEILHQTTTSGLILIDKVLLTGCLPL